MPSCSDAVEDDRTGVYPVSNYYCQSIRRNPLLARTFPTPLRESTPATSQCRARVTMCEPYAEPNLTLTTKNLNIKH